MIGGSALYRGKVRHTRLEPFHHDFEYRVYYLLADLDELSSLDRRLRLFSLGRTNLFSLDLALHGPGDGTPLRPWAEQLLAGVGVGLDGGPIRLLTFPRVLGYVFNPISVWFCHGPDEDLRAVIYEVRNTFGDRHVYVSRFDGGRSLSVPKAMHVSPFNDMDQSYRFTVGPPGKHLAFSIEQSDRDGVMFRAGMRLNRVELTDWNLARFFLSHPLLTMKVMTAIHWQALKIWIKGGIYHRRPSPPVNNITVIESESAAR